MPTTHAWRPGNTGNMFDPANYLDGTAFTPGDTLDVHAGHLGVAALPGSTLGTIRTGAFIVTETGGADEDLTFNNVALDGASNLTETGKQKLYWYAQNQFVNGGLIQVGSATASGSVYYDETATTVTQQSHLTNNGTLLLQNASLFDAYGDSAGSDLLNNLGGVISINGDSLFNWGPF